MSSMGSVPGFHGAFTGPLNMPTFDQLGTALAADPIASVGLLLLVLVIIAFVIIITVFARRSGNEVLERTKLPSRTSEQRQYWITRRRQRFVGMYGGYPDQFGEAGMMGSAAKRKRHSPMASAEARKGKQSVYLNPSQKRGSYLPVFAPRISDDDLWGTHSRLEAQVGQLGASSGLQRAKSEGQLATLEDGPWWKLFDKQQESSCKVVGSPRRHNALRQKSRSSMGTLQSLLEAAEEEEGEQWLGASRGSRLSLPSTTESVPWRHGSATNLGGRNSPSLSEYEMQFMTREPSSASLPTANKKGLALTESTTLLTPTVARELSSIGSPIHDTPEEEQSSLRDSLEMNTRTAAQGEVPDQGLRGILGTEDVSLSSDIAPRNEQGVVWMSRRPLDLSLSTRQSVTGNEDQRPKRAYRRPSSLALEYE